MPSSTRPTRYNRLQRPSPSPLSYIRWESGVRSSTSYSYVPRKGKTASFSLQCVTRVGQSRRLTALRLCDFMARPAAARSADVLELRETHSSRSASVLAAVTWPGSLLSLHVNRVASTSLLESPARLCSSGPGPRRTASRISRLVRLAESRPDAGRAGRLKTGTGEPT